MSRGGSAGTVEDKAKAGRQGSSEDKAKAGEKGGNEGTLQDKTKAGKRSGLRRKAQMALVIKKCWLDKILAGKKVWEIRGTSTKRRGWMHLAQSKSGQLRGGAKLVDCFQVKRGEFLKHRCQHHVTSLKDVEYKTLWAWVLSAAREYAAPFDYSHTQSAVIFVRVCASMGPR